MRWKVLYGWIPPAGINIQGCCSLKIYYSKINVWLKPYLELFVFQMARLGFIICAQMVRVIYKYFFFVHKRLVLYQSRLVIKVQNWADCVVSVLLKQFVWFGEILTNLISV